MRKFRSVIGLLLCAACAMWSCDEVPVGPGNGGNGGDNDSIPSVNDSVPSVDEDTLVVPSVELLPPLEAKQKLESVGLEFINGIQADAHVNVVDVLDYFGNTFGEYDLADAYYEKVEGMYEHQHESTDNAEVRRRGPIVAVVKTMMACVDAARSGAKLAPTYAETCLQIYRLNLPQAYGGFTPDFENEEWAYDASVNDRIEFAFTDDNNQKWVATLKGSKETTRVKINYSYKNDINESYEGGDRDGETENYVYQGGSDIIVDVPETITFTVTCNGSTIIALNVDSSVALDANIVEDYDVESTYSYYEWYDEVWEEWYDESIGEWVGEWVKYSYGGYYEQSDYERYSDCTYSVDYSNLSIAAELKVNGYEESLTTEVTRTGATMSTELKIDGRSMLKASGHVNANVDALLEDAGDEEFKARNITDIKMQADILGQVQVTAECKSFKNIYDAFNLYDDAQDAGDIDLFYNRVNELNSAYDISIAYDGNKVTQAIVQLEGYEEEDEWNEGIILNVRPIIVFLADESRYAIEDYFTETAFSDLIDALEELAEEFEDMYGEYFEEESEEFYPDYGEDYAK